MARKRHRPEEIIAKLKIRVKGRRRPIRVSAGTTRLDCVALHDVYCRLARETFTSRVGRYVGELQRSGFFTYAGARFHTSGDVDNGRDKGNIYRHAVRIEPCRFCLEEPNLNSFDRLFATEGICVSTFFDRDVFASLLKRCYGLKIPSQPPVPLL